MKNFVLIFMLCLCLFSPTLLSSSESFSLDANTSSHYEVVAFEEVQTKNFIVTNKANVYENADFASNVLATLNHKTVVKVIYEQGSPKQETKDNLVFYSVIVGDIQGFILADLVIEEQNFLTSIPTFNAQTNTETKVYFLEGNAIKESNITLKAKERIFLYEGFDSKKEFTAITFVLVNQNGTRDVMQGYIKTTDIEPDGINPLLITCVVLILALLGIIFTWMFMKNKKIKFRKNKKAQ